MTTPAMPKIAQLAPGERVLNSWRVEQVEQVKQGGLFIKITNWVPVAEWTLYLTNQHLFLESIEYTTMQRVLDKAVIAGLGAVLGAGLGAGVQGATAGAKQDQARRARSADHAAGKAFGASLQEITSVDQSRERYGTRQMVSLSLASLPEGQPLVLSLAGGTAPMSRSGAVAMAQAIADACKGL